MRYAGTSVILPRSLPNLRALESISGPEYLAFVVHAYLNETYILEQRMATFVKTLPRAAGKGSATRESLERIRSDLAKLVTDAFKNIRLLRGVHVHQQRFSDEGIDRLSSLAMLNFVQALPEIEKRYRSELRRVTKSWDEKFAANEIALKELLEFYYDAILKALTNADGSLRSSF